MISILEHKETQFHCILIAISPERFVSIFVGIPGQTSIAAVCAGRYQFIKEIE